MCCFVRFLSLSAYSYVMNTFVISVYRLLSESAVRPVLTNMRVLSMRSFRGYKNMDCSEEGDFALLLLAEEAAIPKKNRRTNKQTNT